jgi:hypothetical protein
VAAVLALPLATAWSLATTEVQQTVGVTPTTLSVTTAGRSELRLGVAGTLFNPRSIGPFGVVATVEGPAVPQVDKSGDLAAYVSPQMLQLYTGLFHDPEPAVQGYLDLLRRELRSRFLTAELVLALVGGITWVVVCLLLSPPSRAAPSPPGTWSRRPGRAAAALGVAFLAIGALSLASVWPQQPAGAKRLGGVYALPSLQGTAAEGTTTNSPLLRLLLGGAVPKVLDLVHRQEDRVRAYRAVASASLDARVGAMTGPRAGETAVLMQSDMHCNTTMIALQRQVVSLLRDRYGEETPALLAITGDLTTNGTAAEGTCIEAEAGIGQGMPVAAVTGNHESGASAQQMADSGMTVLTGSATELAGVTVLGAGDPERSELFGATTQRGDDTQEDVGSRLYDEAIGDRPDLLLVHEAYAAQAFLDVSSMRDFLEGRRDPTQPYADGVRDVPASAVLYGHWHRSVEPRVVWNSDGTWTLVMELNTSGGAIDTPTIGHFSTPWSPPQQEASFPVLFLEQETGLVRGYQVYRFQVDGTVSVEPRVEVGPRLGDTASQAKG